MIRNSPTRILEWEEVEPIFRFYMSVWSNHIPLNWANLSWQILHKSGLTIFNNEEEEFKARSYAEALSLIYYEYCHRTAFHEYKTFRHWDESIIADFKRDFLPDLEKDDELIFRVKNCLTDYLGDSELSTELWINCTESYQGFIFSVAERAKLQDHLLNEFVNDFNYEQGRIFVSGADIEHISTYMSISDL